VWMFLVVFPLLLGGQVSVTVETLSEEHCRRVQKLLVQQLDDHRSNATVSACRLKAEN